MRSPMTVARKAPVRRGWLHSHRWLVARRTSQLGILGLFLAGPLLGVWWVKGTLTSSVTLGVLPLTDPFVLAQALAARHWPAMAALVGAAIVVAFYAIAGGRSYCAWVCPMNLVTDAAGSLRRRLHIRTMRSPSRTTRYWLLAGTLASAAVTGSLAYELVNPVTILQRGLVFGMGLGWGFVLAVFLFDLLVAPRGWCGHVCPQGAFYALLGTAAIVRVSAHRRSACDDCGACFAACPEPQVIAPALKPRDQAASPIIDAGACTNCGRCIEVCAQDVFRFTVRFDHRLTAVPDQPPRRAMPGCTRRTSGHSYSLRRS